MKKKVGIFIFLILTCIGIIGISASHPEVREEKAILTAFHASTSKALQSNINMRGKVFTKDLNQGQASNLAKKFLCSLGVQRGYTEKKIEETHGVQYVFSKISKNGMVKIIVESLNKQPKPETYVAIDIVLYNQHDGMSGIKKNVEAVFNSYGTKPTVNISMIGVYEGKLQKPQMISIIDRIFHSMHGKKKEFYEDAYQLGYTGYTQFIHTYIQSGNRKINMDARLRYNAYENRTYLYLATPVIEIES